MKVKKSVLTLVLAVAVMFGIIVGANAADTLKEIKAYLNYGITVKYNGEAQVMKDANGTRVYPISYEGTTYLPIRAVIQYARHRGQLGRTHSDGLAG